MTLTTENILLISSILLFAGVVASKTTKKTGIPVLLIFLGIGMMAGSDGIGRITYDDPVTAQFLGIIALTFILFSGGLDTKWPSIRPVLWQGISLSTFGVLLTSISLGSFAYWVSDFTWQESLLVGAIVSSTDAAAVFSILRSKSIGLKGNLRPLLELESGSNDPMAFFLTIAMVGLITTNDLSPINLVSFFFIQMIVGGLMGYLLGRFVVWLMNHINLDYDGLYPVLMLALVVITYTFTDLIYGNGFLAVYVCAITISNRNMLHKKSLIKFFDGVAWMMQVVMFITLGLLVFPSQMLPVIGLALMCALFLIFVARPIGVFLALSFFKFSLKEKTFISWVGLRGAVPIVFATFPMIAGVEKSSIIFHIIFFIVLTSVALQATTLPLAAKLLNLSLPEGIKKKSLLDLELSEDFKNALVEIDLPLESEVDGKKIVELDFPITCLIVLINREDKFITPHGQTALKEGDRLMIMMQDENQEEDIKRALGF